ncbi:MAG: hypothetical protein ABH814_00190 [bacterium]
MVILTFIATGVGCFFVLERQLVVKKVECGEGFAGVCLAVEEAFLGRKIYQLNTAELSERLMQVNPEIKTAGIKKKLNGTVRLELEKRAPLGVLVSQDNYYLFDEEGVVFKEVTGPSSYTPVYLEETPDIFIGTNILPPSALSAVAILKTALEEKVAFAQIKDLGSFLSAQLDNGVLVWFPLESGLTGRDYANMLADLKKILVQASLEKRDISKIDFRYSKIVVE